MQTFPASLLSSVLRSGVCCTRYSQIVRVASDVLVVLAVDCSVRTHYHVLPHILNHELTLPTSSLTRSLTRSLTSSILVGCPRVICTAVPDVDITQEACGQVVAKYMRQQWANGSVATPQSP